MSSDQLRGGLCSPRTNVRRSSEANRFTCVGQGGRIPENTNPAVIWQKSVHFESQLMAQ
jgi:hypothetical protein